MGFTKIIDYDAYQCVNVVRLARYEFGIPKAIWLSEDDRCVVFFKCENEWPRDLKVDVAVIGVFDGGPKPTATFRRIDCVRDGVISFVLIELMRLAEVTGDKHRPTARAIFFRNAMLPTTKKRRLIDLPMYAKYKSDRESHGVH